MPLESNKSKLWTEFERRWRTSVCFRLVFLATIGLGAPALAAFYFLVCVKTGHPRLAILPFLFLGGVLILFLAFLDFRKGVVIVRKFGSSSEYYSFDRRTKPCGFWWRILFSSLVGALIVCGSIILAFIPWK